MGKEILRHYAILVWEMCLISRLHKCIIISVKKAAPITFFHYINVIASAQYQCKCIHLYYTYHLVL